MFKAIISAENSLNYTKSEWMLLNILIRVRSNAFKFEIKMLDFWRLFLYSKNLSKKTKFNCKKYNIFRKNFLFCQTLIKGYIPESKISISWMISIRKKWARTSFDFLRSPMFSGIEKEYQYREFGIIFHL